MDFTKSSLWKDVQHITNNARFSRRKISAVFHVNGVDYPAMKVESVDIERDYRNKFSDVIILTALVGMGTYAMRFYPNLDNIDCTLTFLPAGQDGERAGYTEQPQVERFKVVILNPSTKAIDLNKSREISEDSMNLMDMETGHFQLISKVVDQLRGVIVGGTYRDCKAESVLNLMLTSHSLAVKDIDADQIPRGVEMVPTTSTVVRKHVNIPPMKLTALAAYLQANCDGIYAAGVACYYQGNYWYVFPPFDTSRFNKAKKTLTVINVPAGVLPSNEKSCFVEGNNVMLVATGSSSLSNASDKSIAQAGTGVRFGNANDFLEGFVDVKDNVALASRGKNVSEYKAIDRPDGNIIAPVSKNKITSNNLQEMSELAARDGALFTLTWEHAIHNILEPGMVTRIEYLDNGLARFVNAVLLHVHYFIYSTPGMAGNTYLTEATMTFFIERKQPIHD